MISVRALLTGLVVGAIVALLVREFAQYGLVFRAWSLHVPRAGEALVAGALAGAVPQLIGGKGKRR